MCTLNMNEEVERMISTIDRHCDFCEKPVAFGGRTVIRMHGRTRLPCDHYYWTCYDCGCLLVRKMNTWRVE